MYVHISLIAFSCVILIFPLDLLISVLVIHPPFHSLGSAYLCDPWLHCWFGLKGRCVTAKLLSLNIKIMNELQSKNNRNKLIVLILMEHLLCASTRHFTDNNLLDLDSNNYEMRKLKNRKVVTCFSDCKE